MDLIDIALTRQHFDGFDDSVVAALCAATQSDLRTWSERLLDGWTAGDTDGIGRARHALKGLCGNYGAQGLIALIALPLQNAQSREALQACTEATIAAILAVAATREPG